MNRDPLVSKIVEKLGGEIDGDAFEECAQSLLGEAYTTFAPVPGGDDAGMDGAVGTHAGPYPLICTTSPRVLENFRENLATFLAKRGGPKQALIATTQALTPARRRNLEDEATQ